jgi:hypothetical protein
MADATNTQPVVGGPVSTSSGPGPSTQNGDRDLYATEIQDSRVEAANTGDPPSASKRAREPGHYVDEGGGSGDYDDDRRADDRRNQVHAERKANMRAYAGTQPPRIGRQLPPPATRLLRRPPSDDDGDDPWSEDVGQLNEVELRQRALRAMERLKALGPAKRAREPDRKPDYNDERCEANDDDDDTSSGDDDEEDAQYDEEVGRGLDDELAAERGAKRGRRVHFGSLHFMESLRLDDNKANDEDSSGDDADDGRDEAAEDDEAYEQDEKLAHAMGFSWAARKGGMERARERDDVTQGHIEDLQEEHEDIQHTITTHFNRGVDPVADALFDYVGHFTYYQPDAFEFVEPAPLLGRRKRRRAHAEAAAAGPSFLQGEPLHIRLLFAEIDNITAEIRQIRATRRTERIGRAQTQFAQEGEHLRTGPFPDPSSYDYDYDSFADGWGPTGWSRHARAWAVSCGQPMEEGMRPPEPMAMLNFFEECEDDRDAEEAREIERFQQRIERTLAARSTRRRLPTPGNGEEGEASTGSDDDVRSYDCDADYMRTRLRGARGSDSDADF